MSDLIIPLLEADDSVKGDSITFSKVVGAGSTTEGVSMRIVWNDNEMECVFDMQDVMNIYHYMRRVLSNE